MIVSKMIVIKLMVFISNRYMYMFIFSKYLFEQIFIKI